MSLHLELHTARLDFRYPFRIAHGVRTGTDVVLVRAEWEGIFGFGEATLPPYLGVSTTQVVDFLQSSLIQDIRNIEDPAGVFSMLDSRVKGLMPAKAALDMALWDIHAKQKGKPLNDLLGIDRSAQVPHSFTIGVSDQSEMEQKLEHGIRSGFRLFKLKLDGKDDPSIIRCFRKMCDLDFAVDANQAWKNLEEAKRTAELLEAEGCIMIEQPFEKMDRELTAGLRAATGIPIIADEACQRLEDIAGVVDAFDGINIKLQKCGGISEAMQMIDAARNRNLKILIGCMSESSIGCNAAEVLSPLCDWADLDGPWLISNDVEIRRRIAYDKPGMADQLP